MNNYTNITGRDTIDILPDRQPYTTPKYESKRFPYSNVDTISSGQPTPQAVEAENVDATEQKAKKSWLYSFFEPLINFLWGTSQPVVETNAVAATTESQVAPLSTPKLRRPQDIDPNESLHAQRMSELLERMENMEQEDQLHDQDALIHKILIEAFHVRRVNNELKQEEYMNGILFYSKFLNNLQAKMSKMWDDRINNSKYAQVLNITGKATTVATVSLMIFSVFYLAATTIVARTIPVPTPPPTLPGWMLSAKISAAFMQALTYFSKGYVDEATQENASKRFAANEQKEETQHLIQGMLNEGVKEGYSIFVKIWKELRTIAKNHQDALISTIKLINK